MPVGIGIGTNQTNENFLNIVTGDDSIVVAPTTNVNVAVATVVAPEVNVDPTVNVDLFPEKSGPTWHPELSGHGEKP